MPLHSIPLLLTFRPDLQFVLTETAGDVDLAVFRISESVWSCLNYVCLSCGTTGHVPQWSFVTRQRTKGGPGSPQPSSARSERDTASGESRGGCGGRDGSRGGARDHQRDAGFSSLSPSPAANGVPSSSATPSRLPASIWVSPAWRMPTPERRREAGELRCVCTRTDCCRLLVKTVHR